MQESASTRARIEARSSVLLVYLSRRPKWLLFLLTGALLGVVVFAPAAAALPCLVVLLLALSWLSYLSWPAIDLPARVLRLAALGLLVLLGLQSALG